MKRYHLLLFILLAVLAGCTKIKAGFEGGEEDDVLLKASESELLFPYAGGEKSFVVTSSDNDWNCGSSHGWMRCRREGDTVVVTVEPNESEDERSSEVCLASGDNTVFVTIRQSGFTQQSGSHTEEGVSYTVAEKTVILPLESVEQISDFDPVMQTFYVPSGAADKFLMTTGSNFVINTPTELFPNGLLGTIQELTPDGAGGYRVRYSESHVLECFKSLDIEESDLDIASHIAKIVDADGNEMQFSATKAATTEKVHVTVPKIELDMPLGLSVTPNMEMDLTMKSQIKADNYTLSTLNFIVDADCVIGADISASCDFTSLTYTPERKVCSIIFSAIPVGPLLITPTVDIYVFVTFDMNLELEAKVSYSRSMRAHVHYDEVAGLDFNTKLYDESPDAFKFSIGPKLEGGISYGIGIGPGISFYGGSLGVGLSVRPAIKESISASFDLLDPTRYSSVRTSLVFPWESVSPTYECSFALSGGAHLYGIGFGYNAYTPDIELPLISKPVLPKLSDEIEVDNDGETAVFRLNVEEQSLLYGPISALLFNHNNPYDTSDYISVDFDFDREKYESLKDGGCVEITASAELAPGKNYDLDVIMMLDGIPVRLRSYQTRTSGVDARLSAAIRGITKDLLASAAGEWKGCNWDDKTIPVGDYKYVDLTRYGDGMYAVRIAIPEEWRLTDVLEVKPHTEGAEDIITRWELHVDGADRHFSRIDIDDPLVREIYVCDHVDKFAFHSETASVSAFGFPSDIKELDLSRCFGLSNNLTINVGHQIGSYPNLKKITLDDCPSVQTILVKADEGENFALPVLHANASTVLSDVRFRRFDLSNADLSGIANVANLTFNECTGIFTAVSNAGSLSLEGHFDNVSVSGYPNLTTFISYSMSTPVLSFSGNANLTGISFSLRSSSIPANLIGALSVTNCPSLTSLECWDTGISSLELTGLPALTSLNCSSNSNLTGTMLPIFDEMFAKGCVPKYDQRYYNYWGDEYLDRGYGFYYADEPERGYHRK